MSQEVVGVPLGEPSGWEQVLASTRGSPETPGERFMVFWCLLVLSAQLHVILVLAYALATDTGQG